MDLLRANRANIFITLYETKQNQDANGTIIGNKTKRLHAILG